MRTFSRGSTLDCVCARRGLVGGGGLGARERVVFSSCLRVSNRFLVILDLAYFKADIRDFEEKGGPDSGL